MGLDANRRASLPLRVAAAVVPLCWAVAGCGVQQPSPAADATTGRSTTTTAAAAPTGIKGFKDHSAAVLAVLGPAGLRLVSASSSPSSPAEQVLTLTSPGARATVTFQDASTVLHGGQFDAPKALADGAHYATQHPGYGGISVLVYKSGRSVVLTLMPVVANGPVPLSDDTAIRSADSLLSSGG